MQALSQLSYTPNQEPRILSIGSEVVKGKIAGFRREEFSWAGYIRPTMRLALITPYLAARNGNSHTAERWRRFLVQAGHGVEMALSWDGRPADQMIALHARRSHASIAAFARSCPDRPLVVVLTGTDLYRDIPCDENARQSLQLAHCIVVLQEQGVVELDRALCPRTSVIYQSAPTLVPGRKPVRSFDVCVVSHLRDEKDPFRAALASRLLPAESRIRVRHVGGPLQDGMVQDARELEMQCPRWRWLGALSHGQTRQRIARAHLLVLSSRMEGGANVICEAVTSGTPVLASRVPGNVGMLGDDYVGYFPVGDEAALARLMGRAESSPAFYQQMVEQCGQRAPLFAPDREAAAVRELVEAFGCG